MPRLPAEVAQIVVGYDAPARAGVLRLRGLMYETADGPIVENLKWGQPAFNAPRGSTLRIGPHRKVCFALFAHCHSNVIASYAAAFPGWDRLDGNRAVLFDRIEEIEPERLAHLFRHVLRYHVK